MTSKVADSIRRGLEEALAYAEGTADASRYGVHVPADIDVKAIRTKLDMTQEEFAGRFGFSINTLRHWEQGRLRRDTARRLHEKAAWPIITRLALATISSTYASRQSHRSSL